VVYLDTSVAVSLFCPETTSPAALDWLAQSNAPLISCDWIRTEFSSALGMKYRLGHFDKKTLTLTQQEFERFIHSGLRLAPVSREMFERAAELAGRPESGLRAGDALHLAAALTLGTTAMATFDGSLGLNAKNSGLGNPLG
jgi:predicted nucleic acid-binding protein